MIRKWEYRLDHILAATAFSEIEAIHQACKDGWWHYYTRWGNDGLTVVMYFRRRKWALRHFFGCFFSVRRRVPLAVGDAGADSLEGTSGERVLDPLLSVDEFAAFLKVSRGRVMGWIEGSRIHGESISRDDYGRIRIMLDVAIRQLMLSNPSLSR